MATLTEIIQAVAPLDGRDKATLARHGRALCQAGLIPVAPAQMTVRHAAVVLLGIYGSPVPEEAPVAVDRLGDLRHQFTDGPLREGFDGLVEGTLVETLANMIDRAPKIIGWILQAVTSTPDWDHVHLNEQLEQMRQGTALIDLHVEISSLAAEITAGWGSVELLRCIFMVDAQRFQRGDYNRRVMADRRVTVGFTLRTILALHEAVTGAPMEGRDLGASHSQGALYDGDERSAGVGQGAHS
ncbi:hypothetical protein GI374_16900 [Paracoccus sp. S-4012]|uniref:hypothetical protein n=1 Tax=Paracoccus sp. S-4012 TaxID=2665648 RepID=UPI0012B02C44|nr:hypothetical protein [Paracoccus sp. S-4012]MRX52058.1 hypothetical protein [Paracoccus sp. S-4012]